MTRDTGDGRNDAGESTADSEESPECDYCERSQLAYEMRSDHGPVVRCIPCLAIERGQSQFKMPLEVHSEDELESAWDSAADWFTILSRIVDDDPLVERDPVVQELTDETRELLQNVMGADAHRPPSDIVGSEVAVTEVSD